MRNASLMHCNPLNNLISSHPSPFLKTPKAHSINLAQCSSTQSRLCQPYEHSQVFMFKIVEGKTLSDTMYTLLLSENLVWSLSFAMLQECRKFEIRRSGGKKGRL